MKKNIIVIALATCAISFATSTKEIKLNFDSSKFSLESIGQSTLFNYKDPRSQLVQHGTGSPVIPCVTINVLMPNGAIYKNCRSKAKALALCGEYKVYSRATTIPPKNKFLQYPPKLVEFVGKKVINGCNVFSFRAFPITCVPKKGKVNKVLQTSFVIEYEIPKGDGTYSMDSINSLMNIKKLVVNPADVRKMICYKSYNEPKISTCSDPLSRMRNSMIREICQEDGRKMVPMLKTEPKVCSMKKLNSFEDMVQENLYINDNNNIVFAPISF